MTQLLQRDAGMIILKKEWIAPSLIPLNSRLEPTKHQEGMEASDQGVGSAAIDEECRTGCERMLMQVLGL